jgi:hypothetical protein
MSQVFVAERTAPWVVHFVLPQDTETLLGRRRAHGDRDFAMRWNVVIGGQPFSKSFLGYTTYKMGLVTREGLLLAIALSALPFVILWVLAKALPPWHEEAALGQAAHGD